MSESRSHVERALDALREARQKLEAVDRREHEPIAIVGIGCRLPGNIASEDDYWEFLKEGRDAIREAPADRWKAGAFYDPDPERAGRFYFRRGAFLDSIDAFDAEFFGISPREATSLDPQQRLLLEVVWEALESAGYIPEAGSRAGVFVGIGHHDYTHTCLYETAPEYIEAYDGTGNGLCFSAGRLSHFLGLSGPSMAIDTACSSSLVAVHLACQSLRRHECDAAICGGVQLGLNPEINIFLSRTKAVAPDGRSKPFDAAADGFGRGEGCAAVVLKRLSDALASGDRIVAAIRGSAVNHDGPAGGLTVPNQKAQEELIRQALRNGRIEPNEVGFIEAHGTGTALGDPIEVAVLAEVFGRRTGADPLLIGSVKASIGHLEAAAGIAGLIKAALMVKHGEIAPQSYFENPNPRTPWDEIPIRVATRRIEWKSPLRRIAGVSAFGMSGTNAHVIVEQPPAVLGGGKDDGPHLLTISAKNERALNALTETTVGFLGKTDERWDSICFTSNVSRSAFPWRRAVVADTVAEAREKLVHAQSANAGNGPSLAFLFTGQGSQRANMGLELYRSEPSFRKTFDRCAEILDPLLRKPLIDLFREGELLSDTAVAQPALFSLECSLATVWNEWGIVPDVVAGHSVGEYAAAYLAGIFSLEDGLRLIAARGRLMGALATTGPDAGWMAALSCGYEQVAPHLAQYEGDVAIAAINSPRQVVISGRESAVRNLMQKLRTEGVRSSRLATSHAFHSRLMDPMLRDLERVAETIHFFPPQIPFISNVTGTIAGSEVAQARYWVDHARQPVAFAAGMQTLDASGVEAFLEIGPDPVLLSLGQMSVSRSALWVSSLRGGAPERRHMLESLAGLWQLGRELNWCGVWAGRESRRALLPTYPFQRERYWRETAAVERKAHQVYRISWREQPLPRENPSCGEWVVTGDAGVANEFSRACADGGIRTRCIAPEDWPYARGPVVFFSRETDPVAASRSLLHFLKSVAPGLPVWVVTLRAVAVGPEGPDPAQGALWGLARCAALERKPGATCLIDLDRDDFETLRLATQVIAVQSEENQWAIRGTTLFAARLTPLALERGRIALRSDARYLVTGGSGEIGLRLAERLVERGARHLVLTARKRPGPAVERRIQALKSVTVEFVEADAADETAMERIISSPGLPIRGIFHTAGTQSRRELAATTAAVLEDAMRGKALGALVLERLATRLDLDLFVFMSSVASVWGSPEQACYAAANHVLDCVAQRRRSAGLVATAIDWSAWAGGGMAGADDLTALSAMGIRPLDPEASLDVLEAATLSREPQIVVADADWDRFHSVYNARARRPLLDELTKSRAALPNKPFPQLELVGTRDQRRAQLMELIARELASVLGKTNMHAVSPKAGFFELGMDSLMAVELKTRLARITGLDIRTTAVFDYASITALAEYLMDLTGVPDSPQDTTGELQRKLERLEELLELAEP